MVDDEDGLWLTRDGVSRRRFFGQGDGGRGRTEGLFSGCQLYGLAGLLLFISFCRLE